MTALSRALGRPAQLEDIPDAELDGWAGKGFDWVWLLGVWQTGAAGQALARGNLDWRRDWQKVLPDLDDSDIWGSCFAITDYQVHSRLGGNVALAGLRQRLRQRGLRLMLDFIPNHTAIDHPWAELHPDFYVEGSESDLARAPSSYTRVGTRGGSRVVAHGRDPNFPAWSDTLQLDYSSSQVREAMLGELLRAAAMCDGVRCDMAMLILPEVFERTWGIASQPFWPEAILRVRQDFPDFLFLAEVYWDLEGSLQQQGFDCTYDKHLYDRLRDGEARPVREHLGRGLDFQNKLARFLENHDEPRAATVFAPGKHQAAAVLTFLSPGMRFFHQGQLQGARKQLPMQLARAPLPPKDPELSRFYERLLAELQRSALREGDWHLLEAAPAWEGNPTWDNFVAFAWRGPDGGQLWVTVNYAESRGQCYVRLPFPDLSGWKWRLADRMSEASYEREGDPLLASGLYLDLPEWGYHVFEVRRDG